jgi:hypothetical protein
MFFLVSSIGHPVIPAVHQLTSLQPIELHKGAAVPSGERVGESLGEYLVHVGSADYHSIQPSPSFVKNRACRGCVRRGGVIC